jgi:hypothetical protein
LLRPAQTALFATAESINALDLSPVLSLAMSKITKYPRFIN